jgi:hypothetical protein
MRNRVVGTGKPTATRIWRSVLTCADVGLCALPIFFFLITVCLV